MRLISGLLGLTDIESAKARQKVMKNDCRSPNV